MNVYHFGNVMESYIPFLFIFEHDIKILFNWFESFIITRIGWKPKHTYPPFIVYHLITLILFQDLGHRTKGCDGSCNGTPTVNALTSSFV
jgi:hypothetical protein